MRKFLAATVATALGLAVGGGMIPAAAQATSSAAYTPPPIVWGVCDNPALASRNAECGFVTVPLNYAAPTGTKIKLAISRIKHTSSAKNYQGVMLTNPGGPGGSGLTLSVLGEFVPGGVGSKYDWIGFDPRGVGSSVPSLSCDVNYTGYNRPYYVPETPALEKAWLDKAAAYSKACAKVGGSLLQHVKTTDTVADMDSIRLALGAKQINYYGFSYGTYLGQVYATLHPKQVRRMVLDGNVDPRRVWYAANLDQDVAFDKNMQTYFAWVAKYDSVYHLGKTLNSVKAKYYATLQKLRTAPADGKIGPDEWNDIFVSAGYYVFGWEDVAKAFDSWWNHQDAAPLEALYAAPGGEGADNGYAMYLATQCSDVQWPTDWNKWKKDNNAIYAKAPFITWNNAWFNAPCITWPAKPGKLVAINGKSAPPILLISETNDAATPYTGSVEVRKLFPKSALIEGVGGTTHAGSLNGVACTDNAVAAYLDKGTVPARLRGDRSDKKCAPVPQPNPLAPAAKTLATKGGTTPAELRQLVTIR